MSNFQLVPVRHHEGGGQSRSSDSAGLAPGFMEAIAKQVQVTALNVEDRRLLIGLEMLRLVLEAHPEILAAEGIEAHWRDTRLPALALSARMHLPTPDRQRTGLPQLERLAEQLGFAMPEDFRRQSTAEQIDAVAALACRQAMGLLLSLHELHHRAPQAYHALEEGLSAYFDDPAMATYSDLQGQNLRYHPDYQHYARENAARVHCPDADYPSLRQQMTALVRRIGGAERGRCEQYQARMDALATQADHHLIPIANQRRIQR